MARWRAHEGRCWSEQYLNGMGGSQAVYDRVLERRRAAALARHFREAEGLSITQIAEPLGVPATIKAYFYDPSKANKRPTDSLRADAWPGCPAPSVGGGSDLTGSRNGAGRRNSPATTATRRSVDRRDRSSAGTRRSDHQGVSLRSNRRKGTRGQGALPGSVSRLRASTAPRNGKGDAYAYCKRCRPGAIAPQWTPERVREAMRAWRARYGAGPSSNNWSRTHARRRGGEALKRLHAAEGPTVHRHRSVRQLGGGPRRRLRGRLNAGP